MPRYGPAGHVWVGLGCTLYHRSFSSGKVENPLENPRYGALVVLFGKSRNAKTPEEIEGYEKCDGADRGALVVLSWVNLLRSRHVHWHPPMLLRCVFRRP